MNKEELRRLVKKKLLLGVAFGLILGMIIGGGIIAQEAYSQRILKEASMELLMFTINVSNYCAESNDMTYQELLDLYVINMVNELVADRKSKKIDEWAEWDIKEWRVEPIHFYYTNNNSPDEYIGDYKLNGDFNISDKDDIGNCWSYNGSDQMWGWRLVNIEEMIRLRRCQYGDALGRAPEVRDPKQGSKK